jgi:DNA-directed RNA polymerase subunit L
MYRITEAYEDNDILKFKLSETNVSIANALRRTIVSDINTVVFITTPHSENQSVFHTNTTRMNNELLKQRLSCIPIHISDAEFPINDYILEINVNNDTEMTVHVTTENFKIKNILTDKYLTETMTKQIFPPNKISGDFIEFVRLRPGVNETIVGETIHITCKFSIANAKTDAMFNIVSNCCYGYTQDAVEINRQWTLKEKELQKTGTKESIEYSKKDWLLLDAQRYTVPNSFDFIIETLGIFENIAIVHKACDVLIHKLDNLAQVIQSNTLLIKNSPTTMPNCFDIVLENEDYTLGKVVEWLLYSNYYLKSSTLNFCGFRKEHPHDMNSVVRVAFKEATERNVLIQYILNITDEGKELFEIIKNGLSADNYGPSLHATEVNTTQSIHGADGEDGVEETKG